MEYSNVQREAAIAQIVAQEQAVDLDPSLESMRDVSCCGLKGEIGLVQVGETAVETHTRGRTGTRIHQETVITEFRV